MRNDPAPATAERIAATRDADPEVRAAAADSLEGLPAAQRLDALTPLLKDPLRAVRIAAARSLSSLPREQIDAAARPAFDAALAEYVAAQSVSLDMPGAQLNLAVVHQNMADASISRSGTTSTRCASTRISRPARANLAQLYNASARNADAERVLTEGLRRLPEHRRTAIFAGPAAGRGKAPARGRPGTGEGCPAAAGAGQGPLQPRPRAAAAGTTPGRRQALLQAQRLDPMDAATTYALAVFYAQDGQQTQALAWAEKLQALAPTDPQVARFVASLRGAR